MSNLKCCGRNFKNQEELDNHNKRRHKIVEVKKENIPKNSYKSLLNNDKLDMEYYNILLKNENVNKVIPKNNFNSIVETKEKLNNNFIWNLAKKKNLKEVEDLDLSSQKLTCFDQNEDLCFKYFIKLYKINLSNNSMSNLGDISILYNLKELDLSNNNITNLIGINNLENLKILILKKNYLESLRELKDSPKIKIIDISENKLDNLSEIIYILKNLKKLKELSIKGNSKLGLTYNYEILNQMKLRKLDNQKIIDSDYDLAKNYFKHFIDKKQPVATNLMYKSFQGNFKTKLLNLAKNYDEDFQEIERDDDIKDKDKHYELAKEIKKLKKQNFDLKNENENQNYIIEELKEKTEELKEENEIYKLENKNMYKFIDENNFLKKELDLLRIQKNNSNSTQKPIDNSKEIISNLNDQIYKYLDIIKDLKKQLSSKYPWNKRNKSTISNQENLKIANISFNQKNDDKNAFKIIKPKKINIKKNLLINNFNNPIKKKNTLEALPVNSINENDEIIDEIEEVMRTSYTKILKMKNTMKDIVKVKKGLNSSFNSSKTNKSKKK